MNILEMIQTATSYTRSNLISNIQKIQNFLAFDALRIIQPPKHGYKNFRDMEKEAIETKNLEKLITTYFTKQSARTLIQYQNFRIESVYRETQKTKYHIEFNDATHFLTISYKTEEKDDIFEIAEENKKIKRKFSRGLQRMRAYFRKHFKYTLKYVYAKEITQRGFLHFHMILKLPGEFREDFKKMIEKMSKWFSTENQGIDLKYLKVRDRKKAIEYILKYISKENVAMFHEIENTKIFITTIQKLIRNMEKRVFSYSYTRRPKIRRFSPQKISRTKEFFEEKIVQVIQDRKQIPKIFREASERTKQIIEKILDTFKTCEWKIYEMEEQIKEELRRISELREAEQEAVDF